MKSLTIISGYLALICAVAFPFFMHCGCNGADILLWAAFVLFSVIYAPLLFMQRNKTADTGCKKGFNYLVLLTMFIAGCAVITKHFHYSCSMGLACASYTLIILVILMQIWFAFKENEPGASLAWHHRSIVMALVLTLFVVMQLNCLPRNIMNEFNCVIGNQNKEISYFTAKSNSFFENFDKNANGNAEGYYKKAQEIMAKSDSLVQYIKSVAEEMMFKAEKQKIAFDSCDQVKHKADRKSVSEILYKDKKDSLLTVRMKEYAAFVTENTNSRGKEILDMFFPGMKKDTAAKCDTKAKSCCKSDNKGSCCCCTCTLICQLSTFHGDILHIRMLQAETLNYLQTMQAKALLKGGTE